MDLGHSERSLVEKLGIKEGFRVAVINPPEKYITILGKLPKDVSMTRELGGSLDLVQFFARNKKELEVEFPELRNRISQNGMLWISWPKGSSKAKTDLNENIVRETGLKNGLVDMKVIAVDKIWSGLKFVRRLSDRK
jgi:hypothetical protein